MAQRPQAAGSGSWRVAQELLERGDPAFVAELRRIHNADELGDYAMTWYTHPLPAARRMIQLYLDEPLNAGRHEALVKRLFKLVETAADDELMGRFLVAFDRSVRRVRKQQTRYDMAKREYVSKEVITTNSGSAMPKNDYLFQRDDDDQGSEGEVVQTPRFANQRLYSVPTRNYLRRRAWRYFRQIGKTQPERYFAAVRQILTYYRDQDMPDGLALIDNWGLMHILFSHSPALLAKPTGWVLVQGSTLPDIQAAPRYPDVWKANPEPLVELLNTAPSRTVRQWAIQMLDREFPQALAAMPLDQLVTWLRHPSAEMVGLAVRLLNQGDRLSTIPPEQLLDLLEGALPEMLPMLVELIGPVLKPGDLSLDQLLKLALSKPAPLALLGFQLLQTKPIATVAECQTLMKLGEANNEKHRAEIVRWSCTILSESKYFQPTWVLEYLDSRHLDVRTEGWGWLQAEARANQDVTIWQKLLESPYDDIRLPMIAMLEVRTKNALAIPDRDQLDGDRVRLLWATVLLNTQRGGRNKPQVVRQLTARMAQHPDEIDTLLPLLCVALRSLSRPEFRAGLVALVQVIRDNPSAIATVSAQVPEFESTPAGVLAG